ncbi:hypothetical protein Sjap_003751 [Stephania japonica]|uniref:DCD domain-containing protein n=1 Tax=Stephania japonica TaxID=461633 RepID=A0AAP0KPJ9_9MAGN
MEVEDTQGSHAGSVSAMFGAIFMCNRATMKECLKRKLFGLPPSGTGFVKKVKAGMVLFLFEYEERKLYGVYQATSDGAINIVPNAFRSSGMPIPAQVLFKKIWNCDPLSEHEFHDAIRDNYYTQSKFQFGLDEDQVSELLRLFNSRKMKIQKPQNLFSRDQAKRRSRNSYISRVRIYQEDRYIRTDTFESKFSADNELIDPTEDSELHRSSLSLTCASDQHFLETNNSLVEARHSSPLAALPSDEPQLYQPYLTSKNDMSDPLFSFPRDEQMSPLVIYPKSSTDPLFSFARDEQMSSSVGPNTLSMSTSGQNNSGMKSLKENLFSPSRGWHPIMTSVCSESESFSMCQTRCGILDTTTNLGDYIPLSSCDHLELRNVTIPSTEFTDFRSHRLGHFERYGGLSVPESSVTELPLSRLENLRPDVMRTPLDAAVISGKSPSHLHGDSRNELLNYDFATASISSIDAGQFRSHVAVDDLDSQTVDYEKRGHKRPTNLANDDYGHEAPMSPYYGDVRKKRLSVFSRLSLKQEGTIENEDDDDYGYEDMSPTEIMGFLHQKENNWRKSSKKYKQYKWQHKDGDPVSLKDGNSLEVIQEEEMSLDHVLDVDGGTHVDRKETPFINFKRRSKNRNVQDEKTVGMPGTAPKRRKLLRPSFATTIQEPAGDGEGKGDETFGKSPKRMKLQQPSPVSIAMPSSDKVVVGDACHKLHESPKEIFQSQENQGNEVSKDECEGDKKGSPNTSLQDASLPVDCNVGEGDRKESPDISLQDAALPVDCINDIAKGAMDLSSEDLKVEKKAPQDGIPPRDCSLDLNAPVHESIKIKRGLITNYLKDLTSQVLGGIKDSYLNVVDSSEDKVDACKNSKAEESLGNAQELAYLPLKTESNVNEIKQEAEKKDVFPSSLPAGLSLNALLSSQNEVTVPCSNDTSNSEKESGSVLRRLADLSSRKSGGNEKANSSRQELSLSSTNFAANNKEKKGVYGEVGKSGAVGIDLNLIPEN